MPKVAILIKTVVSSLFELKVFMVEVDKLATMATYRIVKSIHQAINLKENVKTNNYKRCY